MDIEKRNAYLKKYRATPEYKAKLKKYIATRKVKLDAMKTESKGTGGAKIKPSKYKDAVSMHMKEGKSLKEAHALAKKECSC